MYSNVVFLLIQQHRIVINHEKIPCCNRI